MACSVEDCDKPVHARGWCDKHYMRWLMRGDPLIVLPVPGKAIAAKRVYSHTCETCSAAFTSRGSRSRWCPACQPEAHRLVKRRWEKANPDKAKAMRRREYVKNRATYAAYWRTPEGRALNRRYQRMCRDGYDQVAIEYGDVLVNDPCSYCDDPATGVDHIDALHVGGSNAWTNLAAACGTCNPAKGVKPLLLFLRGDAMPYVGGLRQSYKFGV